MRTSKEFFDSYYEAYRNAGSYEEAERIREQMFSDWYHEMTVGDHAHVHLYTDNEPVTIIAKTKTTLTVRYDKAELDPDWKPEFIIGGFSAHCTNNDEQRWIITENPDGRTEVFRWSSRMNCYQSKGCKLLPGWVKTYDYNF